MSIVTRRNWNASFGERTPAKSIVANATSAVIMIVRAVSWNDGARLSQITPRSSGKESDAMSTRVVSITAARNSDACALERAPRESRIAHTNSAIIVVIRTFNRDGLASVSQRTPRESSLESETVSTSIICFAASRNLNAFSSD